MKKTNIIKKAFLRFKKNRMIKADKYGLLQFRNKIERCIQRSNEFLQGEFGGPDHFQEMNLVKTKLQESKMWLDKILERKNLI
jgi:hypothetical protein